MAYDAFLSSGFSEWADPEGYRATGLDTRVELLDIREQARLLFEERGLRLWTWEHWERGPDAADALPPGGAAEAHAFKLIALFRRGLMASGAVILFVANRRGAQIAPWGADGPELYGTFLELEVYFAIALRKPVILLREEGARLEAPLEVLLTAARRSGVVRHESTIRRAELAARSLEAFQALRSVGRDRRGPFTSLLAIRREPRLDFREAPRFLFGLSLPPISRPVPDGRGGVRFLDQRHPDLDNVDRLLEGAEEAGLEIGERLSRLWLAIQEILPARERLPADAELADRWLKALGRWSDAASWFGLHAHLGVSPLIAQAERARLIEASAEAGRRMPFGELASARYSIARKEANGVRRYREFARVIDHVDDALDAGGGDRAGYFSIKGHALLQNGRLLGARHAFEQSLAMRTAEGKPGRIGEGKTDLGFSRFLTLDPAGIPIMREGIDLLAQAGGGAFMLKSMKKLELAYRLTGRRDLARDLAARRTAQAVDQEVFDQI